VVTSADINKTIDKDNETSACTGSTTHPWFLFELGKIHCITLVIVKRLSDDCTFMVSENGTIQRTEGCEHLSLKIFNKTSKPDTTPSQPALNALNGNSKCLMGDAVKLGILVNQDGNYLKRSICVKEISIFEMIGLLTSIDQSDTLRI
jgi:hypothetical protein